MSGESSPLLLDTHVLETPVLDDLPLADEIDPETPSLLSRLGDVASGRKPVSHVAAFLTNLEYRQEERNTNKQPQGRKTAIGLIVGATAVAGAALNEYWAHRNGWQHLGNREGLSRLVDSSLTSSTLIVRTGGPPDPDQQDALLDRTNGFFKNVKAKEGYVKSAAKAILPF